MNKCEKCPHSLFIRLGKDQRWYCDMHHPDKVRMIMERRHQEDLILNIKDEYTQLLRVSYETIIANKDAEIKRLQDLLASHTVTLDEQTSQDATSGESLINQTRLMCLND